MPEERERPGSLLVAVGYLALGLGLTFEGLSRLRQGDGSPRLPGVGSLGRAPSRGKPDDGMHLSKIVEKEVHSIDERVELIRKLIRAGGKDPEVKVQAFKATNRKNNDGSWEIAEKDQKGEVLALFKYVRAKVRYTNDALRADQFVTAKKTLRLGAGDCDDMCVTLGSLLEAIGFPVKIRVVQTTGSATWNHVYLLVGLPKAAPTRWIPLDASMAKPAGWEAPGAEQVARTGRASGIVLKVRDYSV